MGTRSAGRASRDPEGGPSRAYSSKPKAMDGFGILNQYTPLSEGWTDKERQKCLKEMDYFRELYTGDNHLAVLSSSAYLSKFPERVGEFVRTRLEKGDDWEEFLPRFSVFLEDKRASSGSYWKKQYEDYRPKGLVNQAIEDFGVLRSNCAAKGYSVSEEIAIEDFIGLLGLDDASANALLVFVRKACGWESMVAELKEFCKGKYVGGKKPDDKAKTPAIKAIQTKDPKNQQGNAGSSKQAPPWANKKRKAQPNQGHQQAKKRPVQDRLGGAPKKGGGSNKGQPASSDGITCYGCGGVGHMRRECPTWLNSEGAAKSSGSAKTQPSPASQEKGDRRQEGQP